MDNQARYQDHAVSAVARSARVGNLLSSGYDHTSHHGLDKWPTPILSCSFILYQQTSHPSGVHLALLPPQSPPSSYPPPFSEFLP